MKNNESILRERLESFNRPGVRVGDWLKCDPPDPRCPVYTRFTYDYGDGIQTGGQDGSFYFAGSYMSYSGGLDPGIAIADLVLTDEVKEGSCWFFDEGISGAGRGVHFQVPLRVFKPKPGAKLDGLWNLHCPYWMGVWTPERAREVGHGYTITIEKHALPQNAFHNEAELRVWLKKERLALSRPIDGQSQMLAWPGPWWCPQCATNNAFVNQCGCDKNNLPTKVP
jgi:hypothetical protein